VRFARRNFSNPRSGSLSFQVYWLHRPKSLAAANGTAARRLANELLWLVPASLSGRRRLYKSSPRQSAGFQPRKVLIWNKGLLLI
jgi:hypothetical protein